MKTEAIKQQIISNYRQLSQLAQVERTEEKYVPLWGLSYEKRGTSGFVNQIGIIERNNASIRIGQGDVIKLENKPFYMSWNRTLKSINKMLQNMIININDPDTVTKNILNVLCFSDKQVKILSKAAKR